RFMGQAVPLDLNWRAKRSLPESIAQFFLENFQANRGECAYRQRRGYRTESFTYGEILRMARNFARTLEARGIAKGDRVMLWGENSAEWVAVFFGCALSGVIVVPMDDGATSDFALRVFHQVGAKLLVGSRQHVSESVSARTAIATLNLDDLPHSFAPSSSTPPLALGRDD